MAWPITSDYAVAVQNPQLCFGDPDLRCSSAELTSIQLPRARTGAFATVFRMQNSSSEFAARCFLKHFQDQHHRYAAISAHLKSVRLPCMVGFEFIEQGIRVQGNWFPILKMDWVRGLPLYAHVRDNLSNPSVLTTVAEQFLLLLQSLRHCSIAHGDLQNGNVLISNGQLLLIDYDGMFVPALRGSKSHELGHRNFQHPQRTESKFDENLDNFSGWVIYTSLSCIALDPSLWHLSGADKNDEQLLFTKTDFEKPNQSRIIQAMKAHPNAKIRQTIEGFISVAGMPLDHVPSPYVSTESTNTNISTLPSWIQRPEPPLRTDANTNSAGEPHNSHQPMRQQIMEIIVRQALAGVPWRDFCKTPMEQNNISPNEIEVEVKRRTTPQIAAAAAERQRRKDEERKQQVALEVAAQKKQQPLSQSEAQQQVFEVIVRLALAGGPWQVMAALPMKENSISVAEVEAEVKRRTNRHP